MLPCGDVSRVPAAGQAPIVWDRLGAAAEAGEPVPAMGCLLTVPDWSEFSLDEPLVPPSDVCGSVSSCEETDWSLVSDEMDETDSRADRDRVPDPLFFSGGPGPLSIVQPAFPSSWSEIILIPMV